MSAMMTLPCLRMKESGSQEIPKMKDLEDFKGLRTVRGMDDLALASG